MGIENIKKKSSKPKIKVAAGGLESKGGQPGARQVLKALLLGRSQQGARKDKKSKVGGVVIDSSKKPKLVNSPSSKAMTANKGTPQVLSITEVSQAMAKPYPGPNNLLGLRALAWNSTVVYAIITYRRHQLTKKVPILVPKDKEPPFRLSIFDYSSSDILYLPYLDDAEKHAIIKIFNKLDPANVYKRKGMLYEQKKSELSKYERNLMQVFSDKHWNFYLRRRKDIKAILKFLSDPDPYFSEESTWPFLLSSVLEDLLIIDRGVIVKTRDKQGHLIALTPVDGATIRPIINSDGYITQYAQIVDGREWVNVYDKRDIILFRMNVTPDVYRYGYGMPNMEVLSKTVMSDIFIDKGNLDYYRKGGSVPEGFLVVEPPGNTDEGYIQFDKEMLDAIQRQLQAIIMSDFTQVPLISGGKFTWIDLKGKRRDMQFKELAEYLTRKICAVYQVSPQDVGVISDVNRSTAETQMSLTRSKGLETLAASISTAITRGVIDELREEKDVKLWWDEDDVKKEKEWWTIRQGQLNTGILTVNELRAKYGDDPVPWGDTPFIGLRNWKSDEELQEMQQAGAIPGMPGGVGGAPEGMPGAPMPLGAAASGNPGAAVPNPGQIPGNPIGQQPEVKSMSTILAELGTEDENLDVQPLLKTFMEPTVGELAPIGENQIDLLSVADNALLQLIDRIKISVTKSGDNILTIKTKSYIDRSTVLKLINLLFNVPTTTDISIHEVSPNHLTAKFTDWDGVRVYAPDAFSAPPLKVLSNILNTLRVTPNTLQIHAVSTKEEYETLFGIELGDTLPESTAKQIFANVNLPANASFMFNEFPEFIDTEYAPFVLKYGDIGEEYTRKKLSIIYLYALTDLDSTFREEIKAFGERLRESLENKEEVRDFDHFLKTYTLAVQKDFQDLLSVINLDVPTKDVRTAIGDSITSVSQPIQLALQNIDTKHGSALAKDSKLREVISKKVVISVLRSLVYKEEQLIPLATIVVKLVLPWDVQDTDIRKYAEEYVATDNELIQGLQNLNLLPSGALNILGINQIWSITINNENLLQVIDDYINEFMLGFTYALALTNKEDPIKVISREQRLLLGNLAVALRKYETALEELAAVVSDGLGTPISMEALKEVLSIPNAEEPIDDLVALTNYIAVDGELAPLVSAALRNSVLGEPLLPQHIAAITSTLVENAPMEGTVDATEPTT